MLSKLYMKNAARNVLGVILLVSSLLICLVPGKDGEPISKKGTVVDQEKFANMLSEYYELRGWDKSSGLQTKQKLTELDLADIAEGLAQKGLVA